MTDRNDGRPRVTAHSRSNGRFPPFNSYTPTKRARPGGRAFFASAGAGSTEGRRSRTQAQPVTSRHASSGSTTRKMSQDHRVVERHEGIGSRGQAASGHRHGNAADDRDARGRTDRAWPQARRRSGSARPGHSACWQARPSRTPARPRSTGTSAFPRAARSPGPPTVTGTIHAADAVALQAQNDLVTAYNDAAGRPVTGTYSTLGGLTLSPVSMR